MSRRPGRGGNERMNSQDLSAWIWARRQPILLAALAATLGLYLLQMISPLRLTTDGGAYLAMAETAYRTGAYRMFDQPAILPTGYPALLVGLHRIGLGTPPDFVLLNVLFGVLGMAALHALLTRAYGLAGWQSLGILALSAFSFVMIKHTPLTVSDPAFFGVSLATLALMAAAEPGRGAGWGVLATAALLSGEAIWLRTVGLALVPSLLLVAVTRGKPIDLIAVLSRGRNLAIIGLAATVTVAAAFLLDRFSVYGWIFQNIYAKQAHDLSVSAIVIAQGTAKFTDIGQVFLNLPDTLIPEWTGRSLAIVGILFFIGSLAGFGARLRQFTATDLYVAVYAAVIFVWPARDARFWLPVLPFLLLHFLQAIGRLWHSRIWRGATILWTAGYLAMGAAAFAYSTRLSLAGPGFADLYGDGTFRATYRAAFTGEPVEGRPDIIPLVYRLLVDYEPLAAGQGKKAAFGGG